jgi:DNA processing protein
MDAIDLQLALGRASGLTAQQLRQALSVLGDASGERGDLRALFEAPRDAYAQLQMPPAARRALQFPDDARIDLDRQWLEREQVQLVHAISPDYPTLLAQIPDAPALLYVQGKVSSLHTPQLGMVGSRNPTPPGQRTAREFARYLSRAGLTITSGLALGIDAASHEGALDGGGQTIAVLGTGLDQIYPLEHRALARRIAAQGAIVSEFPPLTPPLQANFPRRNRIISGLSLGILVVEAARHSGSLITARIACEHGREVFAIPGSIHHPLARGCHALIRAGAKLTEEVADILQELNFNGPKQMLMELPNGCPQRRAVGQTLDKDYKILLDAMGFEPASLDLLVDRTGLPTQSVASMLLILELEGAVGFQAGGRYVRLS